MGQPSIKLGVVLAEAETQPEITNVKGLVKSQGAGNSSKQTTGVPAVDLATQIAFLLTKESSGSYPCAYVGLPPPAVKEPEFIYTSFEKDECAPGSVASKSSVGYSRSLRVSWQGDFDFVNYDDSENLVESLEWSGIEKFEKNYNGGKQIEKKSILDPTNYPNFYFLRSYDPALEEKIAIQLSSSFKSEDMNAQMQAAINDSKVPLNSSFLYAALDSANVSTKYFDTAGNALKSDFEKLTPDSKFSDSLVYKQIARQITQSSLLDSESQLSQVIDINSARSIDPGTPDAHFEVSDAIFDTKPGEVPGVINVLGYLYEKYELDEATGFYKKDERAISSPVIRDSIILSSNTRELVDPNVTYGKTYRITLKTLYEVNVQVIDSSNKTVLKKLIVASFPSEAVKKVCVNEYPPSPPSDLQVSWDKSSRSVVLNWSSPTSRASVVKGYGVFRRESLDEPYKLVKLHDFNNAAPLHKDYLLTPVDMRNLPELEKAPNLDVPTYKILQFYDSSINRAFLLKKVDYHYAVVSYDAHGLFSNLSVQFKVRYDNVRDDVIVHSTSRIGAPISYPNLYVEQDLFSDTIFSEGNQEVELMFDPTCKALNGVMGSNLTAQLYRNSNDGSKYVLSFIDLNQQRDFRLNVKIKSNEPVYTSHSYIRGSSTLLTIV